MAAGPSSSSSSSSVVTGALSGMTVGVLHTETWGAFLGGKTVGVKQMVQLSKNIPGLRHFLVCSVCKLLIVDDCIVPKSPHCNHPICKDCTPDRLTFENICPKEVPCSDSDYEENKIFNLIARSYILFCDLIIRSPDFQNVIRKAAEKDPTFRGIEFIELLKEGALRKFRMRMFDDDEDDDDDEEVESGELSESDIFGTTPSDPTSPTPSSSQNFCSSPGRSSHVKNGESPKRKRKAPAAAARNESGEDDEYETRNVFKTPLLCKIEPQSHNDSYEDDQADDFITKQEVLVSSTPQSPAVSPCKNEATSSRQSIAVRSSNTDKWPNPNHILAAYADRMGFCSRADLASSSAQLVGTVIRAVEGSMKKLKVRLPKTPTPARVRKGCRCGNAAVVPGKLTCCGQRCPCYVENKACYDCRCKGCRNPHLSDGKKLLQGLNAVIDTKTNTTIQLSPPNYEHGNSEGPYYPLGPLGRGRMQVLQKASRYPLPVNPAGSTPHTSSGPTLIQSVKSEPVDIPSNDEDF